MSLINGVRLLVFALIAAAASGGLLGCGFVATEKPLYGPRETIFDPRLLGIWVSPADADHPKEVVIFARGQGNRYRVSDASDQTADPSSRIEMDLVRLGRYEYLFSDLPDSTGTMLFPAYRVRVAGTEMRLSILNEPQFVEELQKHPGMLRYNAQPVNAPIWSVSQSGATQPVSGTTRPTTSPAMMNVVLTDEPEKIRRLLIEHEDDPQWFSEALVLHRITPPVRQ